jgi:hypothetical protein
MTCTIEYVYNALLEKKRLILKSSEKQAFPIIDFPVFPAQGKSLYS